MEAAIRDAVRRGLARAFDDGEVVLKRGPWWACVLRIGRGMALLVLVLGAVITAGVSIQHGLRPGEALPVLVAFGVAALLLWIPFGLILFPFYRRHPRTVWLRGDRLHADRGPLLRSRQIEDVAVEKVREIRVFGIPVKRIVVLRLSSPTAKEDREDANGRHDPEFVALDSSLTEARALEGFLSRLERARGDSQERRVAR